MEKSLMKNLFIHFFIPVTICSFLGYLSNDFIHGIRTGIFIGIGFVIGLGLFGKKEKDERKGNKKKQKILNQQQMK